MVDFTTLYTLTSPTHAKIEFVHHELSTALLWSSWSLLVTDVSVSFSLCPKLKKVSDVLCPKGKNMYLHFYSRSGPLRALRVWMCTLSFTGFITKRKHSVSNPEKVWFEFSRENWSKLNVIDFWVFTMLKHIFKHCQSKK